MDSSRKPIHFTNKAFERGSDDSDFTEGDNSSGYSDNTYYNGNHYSDDPRDEFELFLHEHGSESNFHRPRGAEQGITPEGLLCERILPGDCDEEDIVVIGSDIEAYDSAFSGKNSKNGSMSSGRRSGDRSAPVSGQAPDTDRRERHRSDTDRRERHRQDTDKREHHRSGADAADRPRKKRSSGTGVKSNDDISSAVKTTAPEQSERRKRTGQTTKVSGSEASGAQLSSPPRSTLRSAVYYQNRFIVLEAPDAGGVSDGYTGNPAHNTKRSASRDHVSNSSQRVDGTGLNKETSFNSGAGKHSREMSSDIQRKPGNRRNMEMDASSVTMDARGIEIILTDPENSSRPIASEAKNKNTIWKKINRFLQDNRMKGNPDSDRILNADHPEDYRILKKVLNILFLTIGVVLFLAVIVVVIYAFAVGDPPLEDDFSTTTVLTPSEPSVQV
ncbi:uncharacterized protein [Argopecten irradians]|uniref:uncharacterized protein n=1 Tax=Argopecten irradians TaxID=31199 RepID=UPI0037106E5F